MVCLVSNLNWDIKIQIGIFRNGLIIEVFGCQFQSFFFFSEEKNFMKHHSV